VGSKVSHKLALEVKIRAEGWCEYCHAPQILIGQAFHIEHINPVSKGGQTKPDNLAFACAHCNYAKADNTQAVDRLTHKTVRFFNPRMDVWQEHFRWSKDCERLIGRTPIGRATVSALDMNAKILQQARYYWHLLDLIP